MITNEAMSCSQSRLDRFRFVGVGTDEDYVSVYPLVLHQDLVPGSRRDPIPRQVGIAHNKYVVLIRRLSQHVLDGAVGSFQGVISTVRILRMGRHLLHDGQLLFRCVPPWHTRICTRSQRNSRR